MSDEYAILDSMKNMFRFCLIASLLSAAIARGASSKEYYKAQFTFVSAFPVCYQYAMSNGQYDPSGSEPITRQEVFRVALAYESIEAHEVREEKGEIPFVIDIAGQLVQKAEDVSGVTWCTLQDPTNGEGMYKLVGDVPGLPLYTYNNGDWTFGEFSAYTRELFETQIGYAAYMYLVVLDTRDSSGVCAGEPKRVVRYAVRSCGEVDSTSTFPNIGLFSVGFVMGGYTAIYPPGYTLDTGNAWCIANPITSLTVNGEVLSGEALDDYLSPQIGGMKANADELTLKLSSTDEIFYTLYTAPTLNGPWQTFEAFLGEKSVDEETKKRYTRFRIDGGTMLTVPTFGESSRFYRVQGINE